MIFWKTLKPSGVKMAQKKRKIIFYTYVLELLFAPTQVVKIVAPYS